MEGCVYRNPATGEKCGNLAHIGHHCIKHCEVDIVSAWYEWQKVKLEEHNDELISKNMSLQETINEMEEKMSRMFHRKRLTIKQWIKNKVSNW